MKVQIRSAAGGVERTPLSEDQVREVLDGGALAQGDFIKRLAVEIGLNPKSHFHPVHLHGDQKVLDRMLKGRHLYKRRAGKAIAWGLTLMSIDEFGEKYRASKVTAQGKKDHSDGVSGKVDRGSSGRLTSLETQMRSLSDRVKGLREISSHLDGLERQLDDLDRRLGVFEEQIGRVARSVKAVVVEPRPAASEADGGD